MSVEIIEIETDKDHIHMLVEVDPWRTCSEPHIHIYDKHGNSLNQSLEIVHHSSSDAHIKIKEIVNVTMRQKS